MGASMARVRESVRPWVRLTIVAVAVVALGAVAWATTGSPLPSDPEEALLFQNTLLLVVFGSALVEQHFTRPAEAIVNTTTALVTLVAVFHIAPRAPWLGVAIFLGIVLLSAVLAVAAQGARRNFPIEGRAAQLAYRVSTNLGRARVVYSVVFLAAVAFFVDEHGSATLSLVVFWAIFMVIWPLQLPELLSRLAPHESATSSGAIATVDRVDSPGVVRARLLGDVSWTWQDSAPVFVHLHGSSPQWGLPLFSESRDDARWGTLMLAGEAADVKSEAPGTVWLASPDGQVDSKARLEAITGIRDADLAGLIREGSSVAAIRAETLPLAKITIGSLLVVATPAGPVYYQVADGSTVEEPFSGLMFGSRLAVATQVGLLGDNGQFKRYDWIPPMNAPVFSVARSLQGNATAEAANQFILGNIPGTSIAVCGDFLDNMETHTAILGVTGSGKTEFAFDLIRHAVEGGVKVICIDLTSQYASRLTDVGTTGLSISTALANELSEKLFDVETGSYGAGTEKRALQDFADKVRGQVKRALEDFLGEAGGRVGLIELNEISNTKATLWITEIYLSTLLRLARDGELRGERVLVVVEEAHTVMPEASSAGLGDFDSKGTVAKIAQIALQGRKYGVGLLVLAQRTATVSKSVLTQCGTVISFSCIDDTSIGFLRNVFGSQVAEALPNLPRLRAVVHGTWIRSEVPLTVDVPFSEDKARRKFWKELGAPAHPSAAPASFSAAPPPGVDPLAPPPGVDPLAPPPGVDPLAPPF